MNYERSSGTEPNHERKTGAYTEYKPKQVSREEHSRLAGKTAIKATRLQQEQQARTQKAQQTLGKTAVKQSDRNSRGR